MQVSILHGNLFRCFLFQTILKADINCRELMLQTRSKKSNVPFWIENWGSTAWSTGWVARASVAAKGCKPKGFSLRTDCKWQSWALDHLLWSIYMSEARQKTEISRELREQENHYEYLNMQQGNPISKIISLLHGANWNWPKKSQILL